MISMYILNDIIQMVDGIWLYIAVIKLKLWLDKHQAHSILACTLK